MMVLILLKCAAIATIAAFFTVIGVNAILNKEDASVRPLQGTSTAFLAICLVFPLVFNITLRGELQQKKFRLVAEYCTPDVGMQYFTPDGTLQCHYNRK